ncbi:PorV/PorQ family protein [candidate division KSB1 bacterium]|nr:PorV/PorQ family protein [candidate division KSB1 bacterium]
MNRKVILLLTMIWALLAVQVVFASAPKVGTSAAPELMIPMGARNVAMGGANVASVAGIEALYWNPAGLSSIRGNEASFSYVPYFADMNISYFGAGVRMGKWGHLGLSLQLFSVGDIDVTTIEAPEGTGETIKPSFMTIGVSYARQFTDRIRFGTNMKVVSENIGNMRATGIAFDFGLQYITPWKVAFGVTLRNLGGEMRYDGTSIEFNSSIPWADPGATSRTTKLDMAAFELPTSMTMGISYGYKLNDMQALNISGLYSNNSYAVDNLSAGAEYAFKDMVFLRGGYALPLYPEDYPEDIKDDSQFGLAFGAGVHIPLGNTKVMIDYAYRDMKLFDANQYFSIGFSF